MHIFVLKQAPHKIHMCEKILLACSSCKRDDSNKAKIHDFLGLPLTLSTIYGVTLNLLFSSRENNYILPTIATLDPLNFEKLMIQSNYIQALINLLILKELEMYLTKKIKYVNYIDQS